MVQKIIDQDDALKILYRGDLYSQEDLMLIHEQNLLDYFLKKAWIKQA
jgi:hypothetical protein